MTRVPQKVEPEKVVQWVRKAVTFYKGGGKDIALAEFSNPIGTFVKDQQYVFVLDLDGIMLAHGMNEKYAGMNFIDLKDSEGKNFIREIVDIAKTKGSGWVEYNWYHPVTKQERIKTVYFEQVDDVIICSGIYQDFIEVELL
jgi:cytochrome c